jgi:hypothetical protein
MSTTHGTLNVIARIRPEMLEPLRATLATLARDVRRNGLVPFGSLRTVHFGRFVILEPGADAGGHRIPATLVFTTAFDDPLDAHLKELLDVASAGLERVFSHCEDYPSTQGPIRNRVLEFITPRMVRSAALFIGTHGRTVPQIHQEAELRDAIQDFLDGELVHRDWSTGSALGIRSEIQQMVADRADLAWARVPAPPELSWPVRHIGIVLLLTLGFLSAGYLLFLGSLKGLGLIATIIVGGYLGLLVLFILVLRIHEIRDAESKAEPPRGHVNRLALTEDFTVQNPMTMVSMTKPGPFRRFTQRLAMALVTLMATFKYNQGTMGGIATIHFAYWVICERGRRLLFFSNYDGSWENYLGDFIDRAAWGLTGAWTCAVGFPKTKFLFFEGARDERRFKAWVRSQQVITQVWYTAYPTLTSRNINDNSALRRGLYGAMTEEQARVWLRYLGSSPVESREAVHAGA